MSECVLCGRDTAEYPSVLVDFDGQIADVCDDCASKADEPDEPEGLPEFEGAFRW